MSELVPDYTEWMIESAVSAEVISPPADTLTDVLVPYRAASYRLDEYRMREGFPVPVPPVDITTRALVSCEGTLITFRPDPINVITDADIRWIAHPDFYDETSYTWHPARTAYPGHYWKTSSVYAPTFVPRYSYRVGKTIFERDALTFNPQQNEHMWSSFHTGITGALGYTVIMVVSLHGNSVNDESSTFSHAGILCPGGPTQVIPGGGNDYFTEVVPLEEGAVSLHLQGTSLAISPSPDTPFNRMISIARHMEHNRPIYLAMSVGSAAISLYTGWGPSSLENATFNTEDTPLQRQLDLVLGRSSQNVLHTASMALMDVSLYADDLDSPTIMTEIAKLASVYGGN